MKGEENITINYDPIPDEENPQPQTKKFWTYHSVVWVHFGKLLLDIPFPLLILFTLWRMPKLIYRLLNEVT